MPPGGGGVWCDTPSSNVRTTEHRWQHWVNKNTEVPALGDSLSWDTNQRVCDITTVRTQKCLGTPLRQISANVEQWSGPKSPCLLNNIHAPKLLRKKSPSVVGFDLPTRVTSIDPEQPKQQPFSLADCSGSVRFDQNMCTFICSCLW